MGVNPELKFNAKEMLKHILIGTGIEWWAHAVNRNNRCTTKAAFVRTVPVKVVLDRDTLWDGYIIR